MTATPSFLDLPAQVRQRIYTYLLAPHPAENETVVNYALQWPWLENPSNTTFGGIPQLDPCRCPRERPRVKKGKTVDHMYTRYRCCGPEVRFKSGREDLWVPSEQYARSGQINFLRPAGEEELGRRPCANVLGTCRAVYEEAVSVLYRGRSFLFVTGPCPRGRYQAYATHKFFSGLSMAARKHVTAFSLIVVPHEEDCNREDTGKAYGELAAWAQHNLRGFKTLSICLLDVRLAQTLNSFEKLFRKEEVRIQVDRGQKDGWVEEIEDVESFRSALQVQSYKKKDLQMGPLRGETRKGSLSKPEKKVAVALQPEVLLTKWRGEGKVVPGEEEEEDDWSDAIFTPPSSARSKTDGEGWEVI